MSLWKVLHHTDNGGDFKLLHTSHIVEAADEDEAKEKSLDHVDAVHKYTDVTRPRFITAVSPAPVGAVPTVPAQDAEPEKEGE